MGLLQFLRRESPELPEPLLHQEAVAELLATFGSLEEAEKFLREGQGEKVSPRGFRFTPRDVREVLSLARKLLRERRGLYQFVPLPIRKKEVPMIYIPIALYPSAAGAIHAVVAKEFWTILRDYGIDPSNAMRNAWMAARPRTKREAFRLFWREIETQLRRVWNTSLSDVARLAWERILREYPIEEGAKETKEEKITTTYGYLETEEGKLPIVEIVPREDVPIFLKRAQKLYEALLKVNPLALVKPSEVRGDSRTAKGLASQKVLVRYGDKAYYAPPRIFGLLPKEDLKIAISKNWMVWDYRRGQVYFPRAFPFEDDEVEQRLIPRIGLPIDLLVHGADEDLERYVKEMMELTIEGELKGISDVVARGQEVLAQMKKAQKRIAWVVKDDKIEIGTLYPAPRGNIGFYALERRKKGEIVFYYPTPWRYRPEMEPQPVDVYVLLFLTPPREDLLMDVAAYFYAFLEMRLPKVLDVLEMVAKELAEETATQYKTLADFLRENGIKATVERARELLQSYRYTRLVGFDVFDILSQFRDALVHYSVDRDPRNAIVRLEEVRQANPAVMQPAAARARLPAVAYLRVPWVLT